MKNESYGYRNKEKRESVWKKTWRETFSDPLCGRGGGSKVKLLNFMLNLFDLLVCKIRCVVCAKKHMIMWHDGARVRSSAERRAPQDQWPSSRFFSYVIFVGFIFAWLSWLVVCVCVCAWVYFHVRWKVT